jgi:hypothetical protein
MHRRLGEPLLSQNPEARFNELLAQLLAYNIGVIIHEGYEQGFDPLLPGIPPIKAADHETGLATAA